MDLRGRNPVGRTASDRGARRSLRTAALVGRLDPREAEQRVDIRETHVGLEVEREEAKAQVEAARDGRRPRRAQQPRSQVRGAGR